jgi:hypothetical protein
MFNPKNGSNSCPILYNISTSYKTQIPVKHSNFIILLHLRQRVSTVLIEEKDNGLL